jgi:molecular chaperone GrpE
VLSFREEQSKAIMGEKKTAEEPRGRGAEAAEGEGVRVKDRRRVRFDDASGEVRADESAAEEPSLKPKYVEELEARTRAAEQQARDVQARFEQVRSELQRETDETRKRLNRAADERVEREKANFLATLLPVVDNLRRALDAAESGGSLESLLDGLRGTLAGFEQTLAAAGVEAVESVGRAFDPEVHEAVDTLEVEPALDGQVTAEYSRGYRAGGQLLRPARVQVGRASGEARGAAE